MGEFLNRIRTQMNDFFSTMDKKRRYLIIGGAIVFVLIFAAVIILLTRVNYVTLAQNVTVSEASSITAALDKDGIKWKDQNTTTILVDKNQLSKAKMSLSVQGVLNQKDFTWTDAFASNSLTMTSEEKDKMFLIAKASALEQAIEFLDGIDEAVVQLFIPSDSAYLLTDDSESKASVILKVKNGSTLSQPQVDGIVMILVNSVKGLKKNNVSIIDNTGVELNKSGVYDDGYVASSQFDLTKSVETRLQDRITEFLSSLYGKNNVKVMATVTLDFDSKDTSTKVFSPPIEGETNGMVRSMSQITEDVKNGDTGAGAPGTDTNTTTTNYAASDTGTSGYNKASKTLNYELNEISTQISKAKGQIKEISIGVVVNTDALVDNKLTDAHKNELKSLVSAVSGFDAKVVEVQARKFADPNAGYDLVSSMATTTNGVPIWLFGVIVASLLIGGLVIFVLLRRKGKEKEEQLQKEMEEQIQELEEIPSEYEDKSSPKYQIEKFIDSSPEAVAQLLRAWINEE
ncbi:flagellar basal-body MS-ring/collar protein FliF [Helicovermis profundi]|uniref:Flagellar M-ring protein n=1 Tax=Helicovermis profundi TaxID=3065157 RepID=A0AAU9EBS2_9FIRM|nr:flagellar basal-body MS-ring/collar protein FliF [Clostridia bacterium S502]